MYFQGIKNFMREEAEEMSKMDPDYSIRSELNVIVIISNHLRHQQH
jgi:hypothetical protein